MHMIVQMIHAILSGTITLRTVPKLHIGVILLRLPTDTTAVKCHVLNDLALAALLMIINLLKILLPSPAIFDLIP